MNSENLLSRMTILCIVPASRNRRSDVRCQGQPREIGVRAAIRASEFAVRLRDLHINPFHIRCLCSPVPHPPRSAFA